MTGAIKAERPPRGLFDRSTKGRATSPARITVERGRIRFFAQTIGATDPRHFDVLAARAEGHPDLVAPASFMTVLCALYRDELRRRGEPSALDLIGCDQRYLLHGEEAYVYRGLVFAGDELDLRTEIADFAEKRDGFLEIAILTHTADHAERGRLISARSTLMHKFPE